MIIEQVPKLVTDLLGVTNCYLVDTMGIYIISGGSLIVGIIMGQVLSIISRRK